MNEDKPTRRQLFMAEMCGTGLLLFIGLSSVIFMFAESSPFVALVPSLTLRRIINGFFFGSVGATLALSPIGRISGAHINPIVTIGFWLVGKLTGRSAIGYVVAQFCGAVLGCLPLLLWGQMGRSIHYGVTVPGKGYSIPTVILGEVATTFCLIAALCVFLGFRQAACSPFGFATHSQGESRLPNFTTSTATQTAGFVACSDRSRCEIVRDLKVNFPSSKPQGRLTDR